MDHLTTAEPDHRAVTPAPASAEAYFLNYVNEKNKTAYYDREFSSLANLEDWVKDHHPARTSYQVIVVR